jgi:hypothetical protein
MVCNELELDHYTTPFLEIQSAFPSMVTEGNEIVPLLDPEHDPGNTTTKSSSMSGNMKAVHYEGAFEVSVKEIEVPKIQHPDDAIIKVTTAGQTFKYCFVERLLINV